jgi:hypothetical protein
MTDANVRRTAAVSGLAFTALYIVHRVLQSSGPADASATTVMAYNVEHRTALLASEVAVGLALLAFIPFAAALVHAVRQAGQETLASAIGIVGAVFLAMGFLSTTAETALVNVADAHEPAGVLVLDQLQGRTPVVWTITALVTAVSLAIYRTSLVWRWFGIAGLVAALVFLLGSIFSVTGRTVEGPGSLYGIGLFVVWMLVLCAGLLRPRATASSPPPGPAPTTGPGAGSAGPA